MTLIRKPMLAAAIDDIGSLQFPMIASPKLDGIRCLKLGEEIVSRSLKPIPNEHIRHTLGILLPEGADGEITVGDTFQDTSSAVMSRNGEPDFTYWMFDYVKDLLERPYFKRIDDMKMWAYSTENPRGPVTILDTCYVENAEQLLDFEAKVLQDGFEGVCLRQPAAPYKNGRSTAKQGWLLKMKRFLDSEAEILGLVEQQHNTNVAKTNALGHTERSSAKAGKVGKNTLGKFLVRDVHSGLEFKIGTGEGLTEVLRQEIWNESDRYIGKVLRYKFQPIGVKKLPRLPIFTGFREDGDL